MYNLKYFFSLSTCCLLIFGTYSFQKEKKTHLFSPETENIDKEQASPSNKTRMSLERAYAALDKDQYDQLREIANDKEMIESLFILSVEKGSSINSKKALFYKRLYEDKEREKKNVSKSTKEDYKRSKHIILATGAALGGFGAFTFWCLQASVRRFW